MKFRIRFLCFLLVIFASCPTERPASAAELVRAGSFPSVTNLSQLYGAASSLSGSIVTFDLTGTVLDVNNALGIIALYDESGAGLLEKTAENQQLQPGQRIRLRGTSFVTTTKLGISLGKIPVIDNDGLHPETEVGGRIYLYQGLYPIKVRSFNNTLRWVLHLDYKGPGLERRSVPESVLFRSLQSSPDGKDDFVHGLNYYCYEGQFREWADINEIDPAKAGVCSNFNLNVRTRDEFAGVMFKGFLQIETNGIYTFYLRSDDGSQLHIEYPPPELGTLGWNNLPNPQPLGFSRGTDRPFWTVAEGTITFLSRVREGLLLELKTDVNEVRVVVQDAGLQSPQHLLGSRVLVRGLCLHTRDGQTSPPVAMDMIVALSGSDLQVLDIPSQTWAAAAISTISNCRKEEINQKPVLIQGRIRGDQAGNPAVLEDATGVVALNLANSPPPPINSEVKCLGIWQRLGTNDVLQWAVCQNTADHVSSGRELPLLTKATQIQQLTRSDPRHYRAIIRGVVTWMGADKSDMVVQDSTRGVYASGFASTRLKPPLDQHLPEVGEIYQIEGTTEPGEFSPILIVSNATRIGTGVLPEPQHPTFDELLRGSMDSQYVEIRGYVTAVQDSHLTLLMPGGKIDVEFKPRPIEELNDLVHAVVRIRGCMFARWDVKTLLVTPNHPLWFGNATICVETPPPGNPFEASQMHAWELMQFHAWANFFQRVKVFGQVLAVSQGIYYCSDDGFGFRCKAVNSVKISPGDTIEAAGFVELGMGSPLIHEASIRRTGRVPLPEPLPYVFGGTNALRHPTRVWMQGVLLEIKSDGVEQVLQMQTGVRTFVARLMQGEAARNRWSVGSTLKLAGVFSELENAEKTRAENRDELIVNSPEDVALVARPPWWTLHRLLAAAGLLSVGLVLTFSWITLLRSQVRRKTIELEHEISERQKVEQEQAIEQERARIAQDLHDDLGSRTTAISMLAVAGAENNIDQALSRERFGMILDHSRSLVAALDELVWAANPKYDSISALVEYLASVAEELLTETGVARRIELPADVPQRSIPADIRHHVLLAANEALNNAIRHGHPTEVLLQMAVSGNELSILIRDNGCGFDPALPASGEGLMNIQHRMTKVGGRYRIESEPGKGAAVYLILPL